MRDGSTRNFGLLIAYVVPGFVALWGASFLSDALRIWLLGAGAEGPSLGGFLYVTVASITGGMIANAVRWALLDTAHTLTGLRRPQWTDALLHERVAAYDWLVENHYRHYQFYGNTLCALLFGYACWRASLPDANPGAGRIDGAVVALSLILLAGSRSTLSRYYRRAETLLGTTKGHDAMANGGHPDKPHAARNPKNPGNTTTPKPAGTKTTVKAASPAKDPRTTKLGGS